jgi:hypothetical protein
MLEILFACDEELSDRDLVAEIDQETTAFHVEDSKIKFPYHPQSGFALLTMSCSKKVEIKDILIEGNSIRILKYLCFGYDHKIDKIFQPATIIDDPAQIWCMPLMFPLSLFHAKVYNQLGNGLLGNNLFQSHKLFLPGKVVLNNTWPRVIRDFFSQDHDFHIVDRESTSEFCAPGNVGRAFVPVDLKVNSEALYQELKHNEHLLDPYYIELSQTPDNKREFGVKTFWSQYRILEKEKSNETQQQSPWQTRFRLDPAQWPVLYQLLDSLPCDNIVRATWLKLPAGCFIYPHNDGSSVYDQRLCNSMLYITANHLEGVYFKYAGFGLVPTQYPNLTNPYCYTHSVVNAANTDRWVLGVTLDTKTDPWRSLEVSDEQLMRDLLGPVVDRRS